MADPALSVSGINWAAFLSGTAGIVTLIIVFMFVLAVMYIVTRYLFSFRIKVEVRVKQDGSDKYKYTKGRFIKDKKDQIEYLHLYKIWGTVKLNNNITPDYLCDNQIKLRKYGSDEYHPIKFVDSKDGANYSPVTPQDKSFYAQSLDAAWELTNKKKTDWVNILSFVLFGTVVVAILFLMIFVSNDWKSVIPQMTETADRIAKSLDAAAQRLENVEKIRMGIQPVEAAPAAAGGG